MRAIPLALLLVISQLACAQVQAQGGGISFLSLSQAFSSTWHAVIGITSQSQASAFTVHATPGGVSRITAATSEPDCLEGAEAINILFSSSQEKTTSLSPGDLAALDSTMAFFTEDATHTFGERKTVFSTASFGQISGVPTAYTSSPSGNETFRLGYLQDQSGNFVFIAPVNKGKQAFDGSVADFQLMLPTKNGADTTYFAQVDLSCRNGQVRGANNQAALQQPNQTARAALNGTSPIGGQPSQGEQETSLLAAQMAGGLQGKNSTIPAGNQTNRTSLPAPSGQQPKENNDLVASILNFNAGSSGIVLPIVVLLAACLAVLMLTAAFLFRKRENQERSSAE